MRNSKSTILLSIIAISISLSGCTTIKEKVLKKADPAERTAFLGDKPMRKRADLPFHSVWMKRRPNNKYAYRKVYIAPVDLSHLRKMSWWDEIEGQVTKEDMQAKVENIAAYTQHTFKKAFYMNPQQSYKLVKEPDDETLIVEIAIIEAIPNKAGFEAITKGLGMINPIVSIAGMVARSKGSKSSVAFEARIRVAKTGEVVAQFADREEERINYINIKNLQWFSHIKSIIVEWADQFVQLANRAPDDIISDTPTFELKPW